MWGGLFCVFQLVLFQVIDVPNCLKELRQQRMVLVQTPMQYKFAYMALLQYIQSSRLI